VSPDDVDVEPLDADTSVPFLATHCPLDEPAAAADAPPEGYELRAATAHVMAEDVDVEPLEAAAVPRSPTVDECE
jgi:hypothetical protein